MSDELTQRADEWAKEYFDQDDCPEDLKELQQTVAASGYIIGARTERKKVIEELRTNIGCTTIGKGEPYLLTKLEQYLTKLEQKN